MKIRRPEPRMVFRIIAVMFRIRVMIQNRYKLKPAQIKVCAGFVVPVSCICSPFAGSQGIQFRMSAAILEGRLTDLRPPKISLGCAICIRRGACYADSWVGRRSDRNRRIYATLLWLGAVGASDIVMLPSLRQYHERREINAPQRQPRLISYHRSLQAI